jgi:DNA topoisomerase-1
MAKNLLIVESPAKAKTIEKYLGEDFKVKSSYGHIRDLEKGNKGIDIENKFEPSYVVSPEKVKVVKELKTAAKNASEVWLATDEDREGEAIAWHLCEELGLDAKTTKRIVFREITKPAIQKAVLTPGKVDIDLVNAQQARRILDRLVGFELSGVLWRKVRNKLSAGRVQSVAVKLIVEREKEIRNFEATPYYKVVAIYNVQNANGKTVKLKAELKDNIDLEGDALDFLEKCKNASHSIKDIKVRPTKRKPAPPFITSTLQQEASRRFGFSVSGTMSVAQRLYEQGFITYMRTDSPNLSELAITAIGEQVAKEFGDKYSEPRRFKSKKKDAQEAHEGIRPTYFDRKNLGADKDQQRLYDLIWKRAVASQMADAQLEKTTVDIEISAHPDRVLKAKGEVIKFDGFLKLYMEAKDEDSEGEESKGILPPLSVGQTLDLDNLKTTERFTRGPARYTEATLVKKLEELGIGRPSTYAPTISRIMQKDRGYVTKESREGKERKYNEFTLSNNEVDKAVLTENTGATSNRLYSSDIGEVVTDFLSEHFNDIMDYRFTADVESRLDGVAAGKEQWKNMIDDFYDPFHNRVEKTIEEAQRAKGTRVLGKDPESGHTVLAQMSRFGPVVQIGTVEEVGEEGKPRFASLKIGQSIVNISYDEAMELFKLPIDMGEYDGQAVSINAGRYGPYVKFGEVFISIPRDEEPTEMSKERVIELVEEKKKELAPVGHYKELPITKGKGRFGPYFKWNGLFVNIPKRFDPETISTDDMMELIKIKEEKEANKFVTVWEKEKIAVENGRWGPFIRFKKKSFKIEKINDVRITSEQAKCITLEEAQAIIGGEQPKSMIKKVKALQKKEAAAAKAAKKAEKSE